MCSLRLRQSRRVVRSPWWPLDRSNESSLIGSHKSSSESTHSSCWTETNSNLMRSYNGDSSVTAAVKVCVCVCVCQWGDITTMLPRPLSLSASRILSDTQTQHMAKSMWTGIYRHQNRHIHILLSDRRKGRVRCHVIPPLSSRGLRTSPLCLFL